MSGKHNRAHVPDRRHRRGRRVTRRRGLRTAFVVLLALGLVGVAGAFGWQRLRTSDCAAGTVTVAADPSIAPTLRTLLDDTGCDAIALEARTTADVVGDIRDNRPPDLWIPAWSVSLSGSGAPVAVESLASSPVLLASGSDGAPPPTWTAAVSSGRFLSGNPLRDDVSAAPVVGAATEGDDAGRSTEQIAAAMVPLSVSINDGRSLDDGDARLGKLPGTNDTTAASEQTVLAAGIKGIKVSSPTTGSLWLDYPVGVTAPESHAEAARQTAAWLADQLSSDEGRTLLREAGLRTPSRAAQRERAVADLPAPLETYPTVVRRSLAMIARLSLPTRALAVVDVSGSMDFPSGSSTRMELTRNAALAGISLFPSQTAMGLWEFAQGLDGGRDYRPLVPIRKLSESTGDTSQKQTLIDAISRLRAVPNSSTGLYDATLAAVREVRRNWDPRAVNSVLLFTDGQNEDPGSVDLKTLLSTLEKEQDPTRPVVVIGLGISQDADADALAKIAAATGGSSFIARDPADITKVFQQAIGKRAG